jgi:uncharacterized protein (DUF1330 family)
MGYYIQTGMNRHKAVYLVTEFGGSIIEQPRSLSEIPADKALIVVVENPSFDAAALAFDEREFQAFVQPDSGYQRTRTFVLLDRDLAYKLADYRG